MNTEIITNKSITVGFDAAKNISTREVPFNADFRAYCEENICGKYGANYACPPDCGTAEEMRERILKYSFAIVLQTQHDIPDFTDHEAIRVAKQSHNEKMFALMDIFRAAGRNCLMAGASGCSLCQPCAIKEGLPCHFPDKRFSCLSAYCVYVKELAEFCGMPYILEEGKVAFFGLIAFDY